MDVEAANWLIALGEGLVKLGVPHSPDRLACERLMNGTVLVRDVRTGEGFVVVPLDGAEGSAPNEEDPLVVGPTLTPGEEGEAADADLPPLAELSDEDVTDLDSNAVIPGGLVRDCLSSIKRAMDIDAALALPISAGVRLTRSRGGSALILEGPSLRFRYVVGEHAARLRGMRIPANAGIAGYSVGTHTALVVLNAYADPRFYRNVDRHTGHRTRSLLCVPVAANGRTFGCLELVDSSPAFTDENLADLETLAEATADRLCELIPR